MKKTIILLSLLLVCGLTNALEFSIGTIGDPYQISTATDMESLATNVNTGTTYSGNYFKLIESLFFGTLYFALNSIKFEKKQ